MACVLFLGRNLPIWGDLKSGGIGPIPSRMTTPQDPRQRQREKKKRTKKLAKWREKQDEQAKPEGQKPAK
jgi:hypothetical protein